MQRGHGIRRQARGVGQQRHRHALAGLVQVARRDQAVTAVVARPGPNVHMRRMRRQRAGELGGGHAGALHQGLRGVRSERRLLDSP